MDASLEYQDLINALRNLKADEKDTSLSELFTKVDNAFRKSSDFHEQAKLNQVIFDVRDRGYTGEAALVRRGLLDISEISEESLDNFTERLQHENKGINFFGAGNLSPDKPFDEKRDDITDRAANAGIDAADKAADSAADAGAKGANAANTMTKSLKSGAKIFDVFGKIDDAGEAMQGLYWAQRICAERQRRKEEAEKVDSGPNKETPPTDESATPEEDTPPEMDARPKPQSSLPESDREVETEKISPDVERLKTAFMPRSGLPETRDDMLLKRPHVLTADEVRDLHFAYWDAPAASAERDSINDHLTAFYEHTYGTDPTPVDDTGKAHDPGPKQPIPVKPSPVAMKSGGTLADGLKRVADNLVDRAKHDGAAPTIQTLQRGLNAFGHRLRVDGHPGPKTQTAVRETLVKNSPAKIDEATAIGAFDGFASDAKGSPQKIAANDLDRVVRSRIEPLFNTSTGLNAAKNDNPKTPLMAGVALQRGLNDLAANDIEPLKEDGVLGPKTTDAFQMALAEHDTDELTGSFSNALGFS